MSGFSRRTSGLVAGVAVLLPALSTGCDQPSGDPVAHRSVLRQPTNGLRLHQTGERGHAGMRDTNCPFETRWGNVTGDYDLPDEPGEEVEDVGDWPVLGAETVLLLRTDWIDLLNKETGEYRVDGMAAKGVFAGRISDLGVVARVDDDEGCGISWVEQGIRFPGACDGGFAVDPETGTAYTGGTGIQVTSPDGSTAEGDAQGELLVWDRATRALFVAAQGGQEVTALEPDGRVRWTAWVDGPIASLESGGTTATAVVGWDRGDGQGALTWLDAWSGVEVHSVDTPSAAPAMSMSANGQVLAVILPDEVHFYAVDL